MRARKCPRSSGWLLAVWLAGPPVVELLECGERIRRTCERGPYFFHDLAGTAGTAEQAAINAGVIQATGIHYAGSSAADPDTKTCWIPAGGPAAIGEPSAGLARAAPHVRRPPDTGLFRNPGHHH